MKPLHGITSSGCAQVPRTRLRYSASATRSSGVPCPPGYPSRSLETSESTVRNVRSHAVRGNCETSGRPWAKSRAGRPSGRRGVGGGCGARLRGCCGDILSNAGVAAGLRDQVTLGGELLVRLDDDPTRQTEFVGESTGGRQHRIAEQPAAADRVAQCALELEVGGGTGCPVELDEQRGTLQIGIRFHHGIGAYPGYQSAPE